VASTIPRDGSGGRREEERGLIKDLKRHARLDWHGSPVPRWTLTRYGLDKGRRRRREVLGSANPMMSLI